MGFNGNELSEVQLTHGGKLLGRDTVMLGSELRKVIPMYQMIFDAKGMDLCGFEVFIAAETNRGLVAAPGVSHLLQTPTWLHRTTMRLINDIDPDGVTCTVNVTPDELRLPGAPASLRQATERKPGLVFELTEGESVLGELGKLAGPLHPWLDDMNPHDYPLDRLDELEDYFRQYGGGGKVEWGVVPMEVILEYGRVVTGLELPFVVERVPDNAARRKLLKIWEKAGLKPDQLKIQGYFWSVPAPKR